MDGVIDKASGQSSMSVTVHLLAPPGAPARASRLAKGVLAGPDLVLVPPSALAALRRRPEATVLVRIAPGRGNEIEQGAGPGHGDPSVEWHAVVAVESITFDDDPDGARAAALLHLATASQHRPSISRGRADAFRRAWSEGQDAWAALVASGAVPAATAPTTAGAADEPAPVPPRVSRAAPPDVLETRRLTIAGMSKPAWWCRTFPWLC